MMQLTAGKTSGERFMTWVATGFGIGMVAPVAPGTLGSAPGVLLALWTTRLPLPLQVLFCLGMAFLAIPFCGMAERVLMKKDDGRICADEWMLFPICLIGLPLWQHVWLLPVAFVVARVVDIIKPWPARGLQRLDGGLGIVIDDFFAQLYALVIDWGIFWFVMKYL
jgi:phosphatidylglycerophosphatase A